MKGNLSGTLKVRVLRARGFSSRLRLKPHFFLLLPPNMTRTPAVRTAGISKRKGGLEDPAPDKTDKPRLLKKESVSCGKK